MTNRRDRGTPGRRAVQSFYLLLTLLVAGAAPAQTPPLDSAALEARVRDISSRLRCPVCLNLSIADSPSELARDMVDNVREHLKRGESEEQIRAFFEKRYGEWVHMKPPAHGFNLLVWLLPAAVVLGGGALVVFTLRRWIRNATQTAAAEGPVSEEYLRKVQEELSKGDLD
jgi:cytochrome c-type biogenesis protein CcmH